MYLFGNVNSRYPSFRDNMDRYSPLIWYLLLEWTCVLFPCRLFRVDLFDADVFLLHPHFSNCLSTSETNSQPAPIIAKGWRLLYPNLEAIQESVVNTFIFYLFLLLFHIPSFLVMFLFAIFQNWSEVWNISTTVIFMSSSTNQILLCWRLRELRAAVLKTAKRLLCLRTT